MHDNREPDQKPLGISGRTAKAFQSTEITPLLAIVGMLLGLLAILITPKEEEPQIDVTFANVFIPFPGASPVEVEQLVSTPAEQVLSEIEGVEHTMSVSRAGMSVLTVQFEVGITRQQAIVRLYNQVFSNSDWLPSNLGVGQPLIKPMGIDDVPIMSLTLWSDDSSLGSHELKKIAHNLEVELKRVKGTRDIYTLGGPDTAVRVTLDPARLSGFNISLDDLRNALQAGNTTGSETRVITDNTVIPVQAGDFLSTVEDVRRLIVGLNNNTPVYLSDVADITLGSDVPEQSVFMGTGPAFAESAKSGLYPAVTIAIAKQPGQNAIDITESVNKRIEQLKNIAIPDNIQVTVTRDYGETANNKSNTLISKLIFATGAVVLLVLAALGFRQALIVGLAIVITLMITLFASWAYGFTLNRVSLFALIFSIGILVDDAIVVVENIHRHLSMGGKSMREAIPLAVDEVGGPTILATFTVIAALMPMAFVTGLMGPYMSPIPINASMGMLISLVIAFVVTPWLALKLLKHDAQNNQTEAEHETANTKMLAFFRAMVGSFLQGKKGRKKRVALGVGIAVLMMVSVALPASLAVVLKMLPFDNKSEVQIIVDMPEGTPVEQTQRVLLELGEYLQTIPEVTHYQTYAGTAAPINFNGLVRQYYLRADPHSGDIQVNLADKGERDRKSHDIALGMRASLQQIGARYNANVKVVEVPPGPPVIAPIVAEIYGPDQEAMTDTAKALRARLAQTDGIVDVDDMIEAQAKKYLLQVDRQKASLLGVPQARIVSAITAALGGEDISYLHESHQKYALPIRLELNEADKSNLLQFMTLKVRSINGDLVALSEVVNLVDAQWEKTIYHKDLLPVTFVTADMAGELDSPLYGMFDLIGQLDDEPLFKDTPLEQFFIQQPEWPLVPSVKWDGEWQITYETFRDMGIAYGVGMILIYMLVVAQFRSYRVPLIIMTPIPLTVIGVMPGHALLGAQFTATSMIGMIALAGIIVRNSILLVDFINQQLAEGISFEEAVIQSGAVRAKPIILTALAAMIGALFILDDPIFNGLAITLIFGLTVSTLLTLIVIPVMYYAFAPQRIKDLDQTLSKV
ncbi:efflux RND transporter permease subunit [Oceanospirillum linum]|uniref:Multidrug transporter AcrB n=1 Tax=Oceanospirillum linum TaxID=966 RepID=A0A1T1H8X2_OCELI|nr:efflux RND transporter permease subunit [Oceanospirillum linum]OOV86180.1 multidrug transporter AcrB [Oceanospirillum linum]SEG38766.1 Multidrug efflux pump subunit AcrB [Oleiphilus messinensis]SMP31915.1 Multidrug efflux pump subunit AcrB [Oceanospirillum linum]